MGSMFAAPTAALRPRRINGWLFAAALAATALGVALVIGLGGIRSQGFDAGTSAIVRQHPGYGADYPPHGGLAGPSGVGSSGYGADYPPHGGLAGPSGVAVTREHPGYGAGYPAHGGLAGPSGAGSDQ